MRWCLALLLVARTAAADPELPAGTYHVLVVDGARVGCEAWTVTHDTITRPDGTAIAFTVADAWVHLTALAHGTDRAPYKRDLALANLDETTVDTVPWFTTRARCEAALAHGDHVAVDIDDWRILPPVDRHPAEALLATTSTLYAQDCSRVVVRGRRRGTEITGELVTVTEDADTRTVETQPYALTAGASTIDMPPATSHTVAKHRGVWPTGQYGCPCVDQTPFEPARDGIAMLGTVYYTSRAACRARRWLGGLP